MSAMIVQKQYIKWCKGCKNDFFFRTGCGLQNELRTADLNSCICVFIVIKIHNQLLRCTYCQTSMLSNHYSFTGRVVSLLWICFFIAFLSDIDVRWFFSPDIDVMFFCLSVKTQAPKRCFWCSFSGELCTDYAMILHKKIGTVNLEHLNATGQCWKSWHRCDEIAFCTDVKFY